MESIRQKSLEEFVNELASNSPAPGGGAAAAVVLSLSSALASMVFNLTIGKKIYNNYSEEIKKEINDSLIESEELKNDFLILMEKDISVFNEVMDAYHLPKHTEEEKKVREAKIQESYIDAMNNPMQMARKALRIYTCCEITSKYGNPNAISDAGVCCLLANAAIESAILNVKINLNYIEDEKIKNAIEIEIKDILNKSNNNKENIMNIVKNRLGVC